jgi:hypothetical protein
MKNFVPLESFMALPVSKQLHATAMLYIQLCIPPDTVKAKRFMSTLMPVKKFLGTVEPSQLFVLYDYLFSIKDSPVIQDLSSAFRAAKAYQESLRILRDKELQPTVESYGSYDYYLKELMKQ